MALPIEGILRRRRESPHPALAPGVHTNYGYDALDRLIGVSRTGVAENEWRFRYDAVGNRTSSQVGTGEVTSPVFNNRNQLLQEPVGGALVVEGTLDEEGSVSVNGLPARMVRPTHFEGTIQSAPGVNAFTVRATDLSGNVKTEQYEVSVSGTAASYGYEGRLALVAMALWALCCGSPPQGLIEGIPNSEIAVTENSSLAIGLVVALDLDQVSARRTIEEMLGREIVSPYGGYQLKETTTPVSTTRFSTRISVEGTDSATLLNVYQMVKHLTPGREFHTRLRMPFRVEDRSRVLIWRETEEILAALTRRGVAYGVACTAGGADSARDTARAREGLRSGRNTSMASAGCRRLSAIDSQSAPIPTPAS